MKASARDARTGQEDEIMGHRIQRWAQSVGGVVVGGLVVAGYANTGPLHEQGIRAGVGHLPAAAAVCATGGTQIGLALPDPGFNIKADPAQALPVESASYGVSNPQMATSGSLGKPQVSSVSVLMAWMPQEAGLFTLLTSGQRLKQVVLLFSATKGPGGTPTVCRSITLDNVAVSSVQESMASGSAATLSLAFDFSKITLTTGASAAAGGGATSTSYDLTTNTTTKAIPPAMPTPLPTP